MQKPYTIKKAFTMLELIFVIVILGIVSSIGSGIIANVFESYIIQRAVHDGGIKTELAINQLANRLTYRIDKTMIARESNQTTPTYTFPPKANPTAYAARELPTGKVDTHKALEWIGYDNDHFSAYKVPTWSGFADLNQSTYNSLSTPGSSTQRFSKIYAGPKERAIRFMGTSDYASGPTDYYSVNCMYKKKGCMFPISVPKKNATKEPRFKFLTSGDRGKGKMIYTEFYQLASSAFAIVPENAHTLANTSVEVHDLVFYYGYQPWLGEHYKDGSRAVLLKNVSVFRFRKDANAIRLKICSVERIGDQQTISICKEKAVIR